MKQIKVYCDRYGKVRVDNPNVLLSHEHKAVSVEISMSGLGLTSYLKRADILIGKDKTVDYLPKVNTTGDVFTIELEEEHYKKGYVRIQPIAYTEDGLGAITKKIKWEVIELKVQFSIDVMEVTANIEPSLGAILQQSMSDINDEISLINSKLLDVSIGDSMVGDILVLNENGVWVNSNYLTVPRYNDIVFEFTPTRVNPTTSRPDFDYTNIGLLFPRNDSSEAIFITVQLPHSWKEGTTIFPHVHVRQSASQQAVFKADYIWYNAGDIIPTVWQTYIMNEYAMDYVSGSIFQIVKGANGIDGTGKEISSILKIKLYRDDNVYVGDMLADQFDIHIEIDAFGSLTQYEK